MFHEPDDFSACLAPLTPDDMSFDDVPGLGGQDMIFFLFKELQKKLTSVQKDDVSLKYYLDECGVSDLMAGDFQTFFDAHFTPGRTNVTSLRDIYETAYALFSQDEYAQAVGFFSLIASLEGNIAGSLLALSACANRQALYRSGYDLAVASIKANEKHPRSYLLAGYCALQLKEQKSAKRYLALAARLARKDPAYRTEQRAAQRKLLLLQFS
ncbi:MAG: hypothetical protein ABJN42_00280 [Roseibium sp.]|uniref:hypothetical protein n=1 Tax=Roseibium sp. TaxID=1936156 RepID=UPI00329798C9